MWYDFIAMSIKIDKDHFYLWWKNKYISQEHGSKQGRKYA